MNKLIIAIICSIGLPFFSFAMEEKSEWTGSIIEKYNELLPPGIDKIDENSSIAKDLIAFTEIEDTDEATQVVLSLLDTMQQRLSEVYDLVSRFPYLKSDVSIAALLGFKQSSFFQCERVDYDSLIAAVNNIKGVDGYYDVDKRQSAIDGWYGKFKFYVEVRLLNPSHLYDFTVENKQLISCMKGNHSRLKGMGIRLGYDKHNSALFGNASAKVIGPLQTEGKFFGGDVIFWIVHEGAEKSARNKLRGYEILLHLAKINWDYKDDAKK